MRASKRYICLMFVALLALNPCAAYAAFTISSVLRLDISDGSIKGESAEYTFVLPKSWQSGAVAVNREHPTETSQHLDKLVFLYLPLDKISKPVTFATLCVYDNRPGVRTEGARRLLETDKYIFTFESADKNAFTDIVDKSMFDQYISAAANDSMMASQIEVPRSQRKVAYNTVTVNGRLMQSTALQNANGTVYIPVREACNALGYYVEWVSANSSILIIGHNREHRLSAAGSPYRQNYDTIIVNGRAYVASVFFMRALNANIEVDGNNNVVISSQ